MTSAAFSPDGARVLSGGLRNNTLKLWDATTGALIRNFEGQANSVYSVAFSPDGNRILAGGSHKTITLWDATTGALIRTFVGHSAFVHSVAFSPRRRQVLSGSGDGNEENSDNTLKLWNAATGALIRTFQGHSQRVSSVAFSPDGTRILSGGWDNRVKLWDATTGALIRNFEGHSDFVYSVAFSPNGARVLSGGKDGKPRLWDAATGALIRTFARHSGTITSVAFSRDGARVLTGTYDRNIGLWDAATGALIRTFDGHSGSINSLAFSPDDTRVLSGSADTTVKLWDAATGDLLITAIGGRSKDWLSMTPAGFFDASDGGLDMLSVARGFKLFSIEQFHDQLQRKDLVQELLSGDPLRKHADEASKLNLQTILDTGSAPTLELLDDEIERAGDTVHLKVRIFNNEGGGIGRRLVWRVNGQAAGDIAPAALKALANPNGPVVVGQSLTLDPTRENIISVTAYNKAGVLATLPLRYKLDRFGITPVGEARPRMFILAIGVDGYTDPALTPLKLAGGDVRSLATSLKASAEAGGYERAEIVERLELDATKEKIASAFADIASRVYRTAGRAWKVGLRPLLLYANQHALWRRAQHYHHSE